MSNVVVVTRTEKISARQYNRNCFQLFQAIDKIHVNQTVRIIENIIMHYQSCTNLCLSIEEKHRRISKYRRI